MATYDYKDLLVWQKSMILAELVYKVIAKLPKSETYALADQLRRSAVSVPSNIAEGQKRINPPETIHFTGIALGSLAELETQLLLCNRIHNIDTKSEVEQANEVGKMLTGLLKSLRTKL